MSPDPISLAALIIALASTVTSYVLLRLERYPEIVVYAAPDLKRPTVINLVLKNMGTDIAHAISFESKKKIPARAFGLADAPQPGYMTDGPLVNGLSTFNPGAKEVITWGQYGGLVKGLDDDFLEVTARYYSKLPFNVGTRKHEKRSRVNLRAFESDSLRAGSSAREQAIQETAADFPQGESLEIFRFPPTDRMGAALTIQE